MTGRNENRFNQGPGWASAADQRIAGPAQPLAGPGPEHSLPGMQGDERMPWLDAGEDELYGRSNPGRGWGLLLAGLALMVLIVAGVWWTMHRHNSGNNFADGSIIAAPPGPIKEAPRDPGGKTFDGTGDSSFAVSRGHSPPATLAGGDAYGDGGMGAAPAAPSTGTAAAPAAIGVQLGAFATPAAAEAAWAKLAASYDALAGTAHRVVTAQADIGTVYRLQAVAGGDAAAGALCDRLKTAGLNCQVAD